jgi:hypothetical protein
VIDYYNQHLNFSNLRRSKYENTKWNYSYYPIILKIKHNFSELENILNENEIYPRRYLSFLNTIEFTNGPSMDISESVASEFFCLPLYVGLPIIKLNLYSDK